MKILYPKAPLHEIVRHTGAAKRYLIGQHEVGWQYRKAHITWASEQIYHWHETHGRHGDIITVFRDGTRVWQYIPVPEGKENEPVIWTLTQRDDDPYAWDLAHAEPTVVTLAHLSDSNPKLVRERMELDAALEKLENPDDEEQEEESEDEEEEDEDEDEDPDGELDGFFDSLGYSYCSECDEYHVEKEGCHD